MRQRTAPFQRIAADDRFPPDTPALGEGRCTCTPGVQAEAGVHRLIWVHVAVGSMVLFDLKVRGNPRIVSGHSSYLFATRFRSGATIIILTHRHDGFGTLV